MSLAPALQRDDDVVIVGLRGVSDAKPPFGLLCPCIDLARRKRNFDEARSSYGNLDHIIGRFLIKVCSSDRSLSEIDFCFSYT
jgi:hypothetical protein